MTFGTKEQILSSIRCRSVLSVGLAAIPPATSRWGFLPHHYQSWFPLWMGLTVLGILLTHAAQGQTLPPPDDIPEEVLRTEIVLEGRSPVDGQGLTATEYTELMEQLAQNPHPPQVNAQVRHLIFLLRVRKMIKTFIPFI